ncbi:hypothetical protein [Hyalangium gracile]|uniref:hypothetical protein n=1 Tax=Hyalangium gracile TaxID=394092 RepID=UPI001CCCE89D|nr:hypothetical protein [Hyalangium gracile]
MRSIALLLSLVATIASAQQPDAPVTEPSPPPPPPLTPAPTEPAPPPMPAGPTATGPAESPGERAVRYSRFSAGSGGPLLAFTEVMSGIVSGAMLGHSYDEEQEDDNENNAYTGAVIGGLTLGTISTLYQYYVPVHRNESFLVSGAAASSFVAGLAIGRDADLSLRDTAWLTLGATQLGIITVLAVTHGGGDVSTGDAALVGMVSLYALTLTGLTQGIIDTSGSGDMSYMPTFVAPAVGMALGGLLTIPLEMDPGRVVKLTLVPLGVGTTMLWLGSILADGTTVPLTSLAGVVTSFALTYLLTSDPGVPTEKDSLRRADFQAAPVPVVLATKDGSLAGGAGLFVRF